MSKTTEDFKEILLRFVSSELTSHAGSFIGLSVILFAYLNVISQFYPDRVPFILYFDFSPSAWRYLIIFLILCVIDTFIIYTAVRLAYYGKLATQLIYYVKSTNSSKQLWEKTTSVVNGTTFWKIPLEWYSRGVSSFSKGFGFSFLLGSIFSFILIMTFLFC